MRLSFNTFRRLLRIASRELTRDAKIDSLKAKCPNIRVEPEALILGDLTNVSIGEGTLIESGAVIDMRFGGKLSIGNNSSINRGAVLSPYGGNITIGNNSGVQNYSILYGHGGLVIGNYVRFAAHSIVIPANHGIRLIDQPIHSQPLSMKGIEISDDVWVGAGVVILDGVHIGSGAVIAAGSVVTKNIPDNMIVAGVPAKFVRTRDTD